MDVEVAFFLCLFDTLIESAFRDDVILLCFEAFCDLVW